MLQFQMNSCIAASLYTRPSVNWQLKASFSFIAAIIYPLLQALSNKIAERKRKKGEKLEEKQKLEMDKLLLDQSTARTQLELEQVGSIIIVTKLLSTNYTI